MEVSTKAMPLLSLTIGLAVVSAVFWVLERRRPAIRHQRRQPADTRLDLAHVVASPTFHCWHHTTEAQGLDKNFAALFPFIDLAFGTFYMPPGREPQHFGILGGDVPNGLLAQLASPFRGWRSRAQS